MDGRWRRNLQETICLEEQRQDVHERLAMTARNIQRVRGPTDKPRLPMVELSQVVAHVRGYLVKRLHADRHANVGITV